MSEPPPHPLTEQWEATIATIKALAEAPDAVDADSRTAALKFIWSAALGNRDKVNLPPDTRQLLHVADNAQLAEHVARAATKAVVGWASKSSRQQAHLQPAAALLQTSRMQQLQQCHVLRRLLSCLLCSC
jgi:hypothetical protein